MGSLTVEVSKLSDKPNPVMTETIRDGKTYTIVREGLAEILNPKQQPKDDRWKDGSHGPPESQDVFYNPIQQFNRDLSVLAIRAFGEDLAVIREARQKRRKPSVARGESRGQKRKRGVEDEGIQQADGVAKKHGTIVEPVSGNGIATAVNSAMEEAEGPPTDTEPIGLPNTGGQKRKRGLEDDGVLEAGSGAKNYGPIVETVSGHEIPSASKTAKDEVEIPPTGAEFIGMPIHSGTSEAAPPGETTSSSKSHFRILDALSATGLRAIRYAKEIPETTMVTANDLSAQATASIRLNVLHNEIPDKVNVLTGDARVHMHHVAAPTKRDSKKGEQHLYEVIDLDPYGTAAPFLDAAVRALVDGGLLCVTCTDAGVFASTGYLEKTFSQYGGLPFKGHQAHEGGLRLVLHAIAVCAARYGLAIEPLLSLSIDFYVRVFVRVYRSPAQVKFLAGKTMLVYNCDMGCGAWNTQFLAQTRALKAKNGNTIHKFGFAQAPSTSPFCEHCGFKTHLSGPVWGGPIQNPFFIRRILDALPSLDTETYGTIPRIEGMLSVAYQETLFGVDPEDSLDSDEITRPVPQIDPTLRDHHPFFFNICALAGILHCVGPSDAVFCSALQRLGYRTSRSHTKAGSVRTDAPWSVVWEVMREWIRQKAPVKENAIRKGTAGWGIMKKDRSKMTLNSVKMSLKQVQEKSEDLQSIRTELEAILYRLREVEGQTNTPPVTTSHPAVAAAVLSEQPPNSENQTPSSAEPSSPPPATKSSIPIPTPTNELDIVFDVKRARPPSPARKIVRYQMNPRPEWGPISRAKGG